MTSAYRSPEGRMHPNAYTAEELHRHLVEDAVKYHATDLQWAVVAYARIGQLTGHGPEAAITAVMAEVETLTGIPGLPVG